MAIVQVVNFTRVRSNFFLPWLWMEWYFCMMYKKMPWKIKVSVIFQIHLTLRKHWGFEWCRWLSVNWHRNTQPCCWGCPAINVAHKKLTQAGIVDKHKLFLLVDYFSIGSMFCIKTCSSHTRQGPAKGKPWKNPLEKGGGGSRAASFSISLQLDCSKCNTKPDKGWLAEKGGPWDEFIVSLIYCFL